MPVGTSVLRSDYSRVWFLENRAGPNVKRTYGGLYRAGAFQWDQGGVKLIKVPDPNQYGAFITVGKIPDDPGMPQIDLEARYTQDLSDLLRLAARNCDNDVQIHIGKCRNPQDFNLGWDKVLVLEAGKITTYKTTDLGALDPSQRDLLNETVTVIGETAYEIKRLDFGSVANDIIVREIKAITFCDAASCGLCGLPSDGCQVILAASVASGGSPGYLAKVIWSQDGGKTWFDTVAAGLGATEDITAIQCIGSNVHIVTTLGVYYMPLTQLFARTGIWTKVTTGLVLAAGAPVAMISLDPMHTIVVGAGGYIYSSTDPTSAFTVQDAGQATSSQYNDVDYWDLNNMVAVGQFNAVSFTNDGGYVWTPVTGPLGGVNLNAVSMRTEQEWWVTTASGRLFFTQDSGATWTERLFPSSGTGVARDIKFVTPSVGYMTHDTAANVGRVLRTIDGGFSWYVLPEGSGSVPANTRLNALGICSNVNLVFAGGLASGVGATDGILVKGN